MKELTELEDIILKVYNAKSEYKHYAVSQKLNSRESSSVMCSFRDAIIKLEAEIGRVYYKSKQGV